MRRVWLVAWLLAAGAAAQAPADSLAAGHPDELYVGGALASVALAYTAGMVANAFDRDDEAGSVAVLLAIPAGAALGVIGTGRLRGLPGSADGAVRGALRGALFGYAGVLLVVATAGQGLSDGETGALLLTAAVGAVLPVVLSVRGYRAVPVRVRTPDGALRPGLAVRIGL